VPKVYRYADAASPGYPPYTNVMRVFRKEGTSRIVPGKPYVRKSRKPLSGFKFTLNI
jgi:hypothetical protein